MVGGDVGGRVGKEVAGDVGAAVVQRFLKLSFSGIPVSVASVSMIACEAVRGQTSAALFFVLAEPTKAPFTVVAGEMITVFLKNSALCAGPPGWASCSISSGVTSLSRAKSSKG